MDKVLYCMTFGVCVGIFIGFVSSYFVTKNVNKTDTKRIEIEKCSHRILDLFDDFLSERNIKIQTSEKEKIQSDAFEDNEAVIYGTDYWNLYDDIVKTIRINTN